MNSYSSQTTAQLAHPLGQTLWSTGPLGRNRVLGRAAGDTIGSELRVTSSGKVTTGSSDSTSLLVIMCEMDPDLLEES